MYREGDAYAVPVLRAFDDRRHLIAWCRYCDCWHEHERVDGYRPAQCATRTPYTETGYILVCMACILEGDARGDDGG